MKSRRVTPSVGDIHGSSGIQIVREPNRAKVSGVCRSGGSEVRAHRMSLRSGRSITSGDTQDGSLDGEAWYEAVSGSLSDNQMVILCLS